jgi:hypothetical protein
MAVVAFDGRKIDRLTPKVSGDSLGAPGGGLPGLVSLYPFTYSSKSRVWRGSHRARRRLYRITHSAAGTYLAGQHQLHASEHAEPAAPKPPAHSGHPTVAVPTQQAAPPAAARPQQVARATPHQKPA